MDADRGNWRHTGFSRPTWCGPEMIQRYFSNSGLSRLPRTAVCYLPLLSSRYGQSRGRDTASSALRTLYDVRRSALRMMIIWSLRVSRDTLQHTICVSSTDQLRYLCPSASPGQHEQPCLESDGKTNRVPIASTASLSLVSSAELLDTNLSINVPIDPRIRLHTNCLSSHYPISCSTSFDNPCSFDREVWMQSYSNPSRNQPQPLHQVQQ